MSAYRPTAVSISLGVCVRSLRERDRYTQAELADLMSERLGTQVHPLIVLRTEQGTRATTADEIDALARIFRVRPGHFFV